MQEAERAERAIKDTAANLRAMVLVVEPPMPVQEQQNEQVETAMHFQTPEQLMNILSDLEEQNLFLIQNAQEVEEALDALDNTFRCARVVWYAGRQYKRLGDHVVCTFLFTCASSCLLWGVQSSSLPSVSGLSISVLGVAVLQYASGSRFLIEFANLTPDHVQACVGQYSLLWLWCRKTQVKMQSELDALIAQEQALALTIQQEADKVSLLRERMQDTHLVPSADQSVSLEALNSKVRCEPLSCLHSSFL
jgi:hypothetical protein